MVVTVKSDVIKMLVDCFEQLTTAFQDEEGKDKLASLRTRARDMPSELVSKSLAYVITLCAARGDKDVIEKSLYVNSCSDLLTKLSSDIRNLKKEEFGYSLYAILLLLSLKNLGLISGGRLSDIIKGSLDNPTIDSTSYIVMDWIKRLAEAYIKK